MRAEWQKCEYILLALPHKNSDWSPYLEEILSSYLDFAKAISKHCKVLLVHHESADLTEFEKLNNIEFYCFNTNDTWIRDFGPIDNNLDFIFNAWGNKFSSNLDNAFNESLFKNYLKKDLKKIDFILEGGSIDTNGKVLLTTSECLLNDNRNKLSKEEIENTLKEHLKVSEVLWLENGVIIGDDTDSHVDTLARFIDENTIAYSSCEDLNDENYASLKAMEDELKKTKYNLISLPIPSKKYYEGKRLGCTYANFVFVNDALIMPCYDDKNDEIVKEKLQAALPNHEIIMVNSLVFVRQNGSLHCSCMNIFKD